ncbi:MAG: Hsp70 family protein [Bacteroidetes bacterium]|nr:Hsp70 family protein [Bacteroidota bacterium]
MNKTLCIDFGNSKTKVSFFSEAGVIVIPSCTGENSIDSSVTFMGNGSTKIGNSSKYQILTNAISTATSLKRLLVTQIENVEKLHRYNHNSIVVESNSLFYKIGNEKYKPEEIIVLIFKEIKKNTESYLKQEIKEAILTIPASFRYNQRLLLQSACRKAGFKVKRLLNEQTSAVVAYSNFNDIEEKKFLVFDFGSGKLAISIIEVTSSLYQEVASIGNNFFGGEDIDFKIVELLISNFQQNEGIDLSKDKIALLRLKEASENAKKELSENLSTHINIPFICSYNGVEKHLLFNLTREIFEELLDSFVSEVVNLCSEIVRKAKLNYKDIDEIILLGGSSRIPLFQKLLKNLFTNATFRKAHSDDLIAIGAAMQNGHMECKVKEVRTIDVTPCEIGIELKDGRFHKLIESNSIYPLNKLVKISTVRNLQNTVNVIILEEAKENTPNYRRLGQIKLTGLLPAAMGATEIQLKIDIDKNGIINLSVFDTESKIRIFKTLDSIEENFSNEKNFAVNLFNEADKNSTLESKQFIDDNSIPIESAPKLYTINGIGTKIYDDTLYFVIFFIPFFAISRYSLEKQNENMFIFYGRLNLHNWQVIWNCFVFIILFIIFLVIII